MKDGSAHILEENCIPGVQQASAECDILQVHKFAVCCVCGCMDMCDAPSASPFLLHPLPSAYLYIHISPFQCSLFKFTLNSPNSGVNNASAGLQRNPGHKIHICCCEIFICLCIHLFIHSFICTKLKTPRTRTE